MILLPGLEKKYTLQPLGSTWGTLLLFIAFLPIL